MAPETITTGPAGSHPSNVDPRFCPLWHARILDQAEEIKTALRSGNFEFYRKSVQARREIYVQKPTGWRGLEFDTDPEVQKALDRMKGITEKGASDQQDHMKNYTDDVRSLGDDKSIQGNKPAWEQRVRTSGEAAKKKSAASIDKAVDDTIAQIKKLPESKQDAAGEKGQKGIDIIGTIVDTVSGQVGKVISEIFNFFKGIWDGLVNAFNTVKNVVTGAIGFLGWARVG